MSAEINENPFTGMENQGLPGEVPEVDLNQSPAAEGAPSTLDDEAVFTVADNVTATDYEQPRPSMIGAAPTRLAIEAGPDPSWSKDITGPDEQQGYPDELALGDTGNADNPWRARRANDNTVGEGPRFLPVGKLATIHPDLLAYMRRRQANDS